VADLAVGAERGDTDGMVRGALYVLFLKEFNVDPEITSPDMVDIPENTTAVLTMTASDLDMPPQTVTLTAVGGGDQAQFGITSDAGALVQLGSRLRGADRCQRGQRPCGHRPTESSFA
jgi:hypothetical protein